MQSFTDSKGHLWRLSVNAWTVKQVKDRTQILLTTMVEEKCQLVAELYRDPILLADILWVLVEDQAKQDGVEIRQFVEALEGDSVGAARKALFEATFDFFDDQENRDGARAVLQKILGIAEKVREGAMQATLSLDTDLLAKNILDSVSSLQESAV